MSILDREQVLNTDLVADWLAKQLAALPDTDLHRSHRLILANFTVCYTKYTTMQEGLSAVFNREYLSTLFIELRQAAWAVRLAAWLHRDQPGWDDSWFAMEDEL